MPGLCVSTASEIWSPIVNTGFSDVIGSWKIIAISPPRSARSSFFGILTRSLPLVQRLAGRDAAGRHGNQPEHGEHRDALARSRLADDAEHLAGMEVVADPGDRLDDPVLGAELDRQVTDLRGSARPWSIYARIRRCVGSSASRRPSPTKLMHMAMRMIARPGNTTSHQRVKPSLCPSTMSFPSAALGGWMP